MADYIWNASDLSSALGVEVDQQLEGNAIQFNSCDVKENDIFIALPGERRHGDEFIGDALEKGASIAISASPSSDRRVITVPNTILALESLAVYRRNKVKCKIIGVTGSVGKTSTKEYLAHILGAFATVYVSRGNFNNHIGVPLTIASIPNDAEICVCEMGMNHSGEIRYLSKIAKPNIAIITKIAPAHIEFLGTLENICKAKSEIFEYMDKTGVAIINRDCDFYELQRSILKSLSIHNIMTFGENAEADCILAEYRKDKQYSYIEYKLNGESYSTNTYIHGKHHAFNIGIAILCASVLGYGVDEAVELIASLEQNAGRGEEFDLEIGGCNFRIIDDAYNANPESMRAAFHNLATNEGKKIAIIADMKELGENSAKYHEDLIQFARSSRINYLFTVGPLMENLYNLAKAEIESTYHYDSMNQETYSKVLEKMIECGDATILIKGSNSMGLGKFVEYLKKAKS